MRRSTIVALVCTTSSMVSAETFQRAYVCQIEEIVFEIADRLQADPSRGVAYMQLTLSEVTHNDRPVCAVAKNVTKATDAQSTVITDLKNHRHVEIIPVTYLEDGLERKGYAVRFSKNESIEDLPLPQIDI